MGGLQLVMPQAFAETDCGALAKTGRNLVEFNLTGESVKLPIMGGKTYNRITSYNVCYTKLLRILPNLDSKILQTSRFSRKGTV